MRPPGLWRERSCGRDEQQASVRGQGTGTKLSTDLGGPQPPGSAGGRPSASRVAQRPLQELSPLAPWRRELPQYPGLRLSGAGASGRLCAPGVGACARAGPAGEQGGFEPALGDGGPKSVRGQWGAGQGHAAAWESPCPDGWPVSPPHRPSPVLLSCGVPLDLARNAIRLSVGRGTTRAEVDLVVQDLKQAVARLEGQA